MPYQPTLNFKTSSGTDLGNLGWITKEYLMTVYPQISNQLITPELWVWGYNADAAQLGNNGNGSAAFIPVTTFAGGANWKQISVSASSGLSGCHMAAIKSDGTLWTWGRNDSMQLGNGSAAFQGVRSTPVTTFLGGTNWKQVSCGGNHTVAIKTDGTLWTWGGNTSGQLGDSTSTNRSTPVTTFAGGTNWKQVSGGLTYTASIKTDGTLWVWGNNSGAQLGDNTTANRLTPVTTFAGGTNWKQVACGSNSFHTAAIKTDGTLWIWGNNGYGKLGVNDTNNRTTPVTTFSGGTNWKQVATAQNHTAAIKTDGTLWTWGYNFWGQLGNNQSGAISPNQLTPITTFAGGTNWKQVSCGNVYTGAIKTDGTLWGWGRPSVGQLGNNSSSPNRPTPVTTFLGGTAWKQVACGGNQSDGNTGAIRTSDDLQGI